MQTAESRSIVPTEQACSVDQREDGRGLTCESSQCEADRSVWQTVAPTKVKSIDTDGDKSHGECLAEITLQRNEEPGRETEGGRGPRRRARTLEPCGNRQCAGEDGQPVHQDERVGNEVRSLKCKYSSGDRVQDSRVAVARLIDVIVRLCRIKCHVVVELAVVAVVIGANALRSDSDAYVT